MKTIIYFIFFTVLLVNNLRAQESNCDFGFTAQIHIDKAIEWKTQAQDYFYRGDPRRLACLLKAEREFKSVLEFNPDCDEIFLELADIYAKAGQISLEDVEYARTKKECVSAIQVVRNYFDMAQFYLARVVQYSNNPDNRKRANNLSYEIDSKDNDLVTSGRKKIWAIEDLKKKNEELKDSEGFFTLGIGYGKTYGQTGIKASLFTKSAYGVGIVGSIGYPEDYFLKDDKSVPLLWAVGGGWCLGTNNYDFQLLGMYGKIQTQKNFYENTGGITISTNIKLFKKLRLNADIGYWLSDTSDIAAVFGFSVGLCYKFNF